MQNFLQKSINWDKIEFLIDTNIFPKEIILKSAFNFLDRWYFFFKFDENKNIILQLTKREENDENLEKIIENFSDTLLETYLRDKIEKDNKTIRETIVTKAINWPLDYNNFVSLDTEKNWNENEIDFDKDIDEILAEIENDPDLKIDEEEIEKILAEIEAESLEMEKPKLSVNLDWIKKAKENFKK